MAKRWLCALGMSMVLLTACGRGETPAAGSSPSPTFRLATAIIDTGAKTVLIDVEIADTPELRARGLMGRTELPPDYGMIFVFFEETSSGFYMKDTLIPLSIAFFDVDGTIIEILDMEPCKTEPCPIYGPQSPYRGAIEVAQGSFERWDVEEGDRIRVSH